MKTSYLLNVLIASLRNNVNVIKQSRYDSFVVDLVKQNFRSIYDGLVGITDRDAEDKDVTKRFWHDMHSLSMEFYAKKTLVLDKQQYITVIKKIIDKTIDAAARDGYCIEDDGGDQPEPAAEPEPPAADGTPDDGKKPPKPSQTDLAKVVKLLQGIEKNILEIIKILDK